MAQPTSLTINTGQQLSIGGVSTLDRGQFFTHTSTIFPPSSTTSNPEMRNLRLEIYSENGLNLTAGRVSTEPFVFAAHFRNNIPNFDADDNVMYERVSNGDYVETIIGNTMRMYAPVKGDYICVHGANDDLQAAAFRDGDRIYLLLNNLLNSTQQVNLNLLLSDLGTINSALISRVFRLNAAGNLFIENQDITNSFGSLVLNAKEGAVITFDISNDSGFTQTLFEETFFGDQIAVALNDGAVGQSPEVLIDADTSGAMAAKLRVGYSRSVGVDAFTVSINGNTISVPGVIRGVDDEEFGSIDDGLVSREIIVPIGFLNDGQNLLRFNFTGGGFLSSTALVVTAAPVDPILLGDTNLNGEVNFLDIASFIEILTSGPFLAEADTNQDGGVNFLDIASFIAILTVQ